MTREEDIEYSFIENDRIWPPFISCNRNHPFMKALVEVLKRLPDDAYDAVDYYVLFVVEDDAILATNAPFERRYPPTEKGLTIRFDTIVILIRLHMLKNNCNFLLGMFTPKGGYGDEKSNNSFAFEA